MVLNLSPGAHALLVLLAALHPAARTMHRLCTGLDADSDPRAAEARVSVLLLELSEVGLTERGQTALCAHLTAAGEALGQDLLGQEALNPRRREPPCSPTWPPLAADFTAPLAHTEVSA